MWPCNDKCNGEDTIIKLKTDEGSTSDWKHDKKKKDFGTGLVIRQHKS